MSYIPETLMTISNIFWRWPTEASTKFTDHEHTIVTAFFDTGRGEWKESGGRPSDHLRTVDTYMERFGYLAKIKNRMIVFTEPRFAERVLDIRRSFGLADYTTIITIDTLYQQPILTPALGVITDRMLNPHFQRMLRVKNLPEFREPRYVLTVSLKPCLVRTAIALQLIDTEEASWIDFGYCRNDAAFDATRPWTRDSGGLINLFYVMALDDIPIFTVVRSGEMYFIANHMFGPRQAWIDYAENISRSFDCLAECGLIDDEQTMMLMAWRRHKDSYNVHPLRPKQWFSTLQLADSDATAIVAALPKPGARANRPLWLEEIAYAIDRSDLKESWKRTRRGLKRGVRALFGYSSR